MRMQFRSIGPIASKVALALARFGINLADPVVVGLSGGKDSLTLAVVLRHMGFQVVPVVADLNYPSFDAEGIRDYGNQLGLQVIMTDCDDAQSLVPKERTELSKLLLGLNDNTSTPCGFCTRAKRLLLRRVGQEIGSRFIALGHHRDDLITTLMKDYFVALYYREIGKYEEDRFRAFIASCSIDMDELSAMISQRRASTMGVCTRLKSETWLVRPLGLVPEEQIEEFVELNHLRTFGSGCSHASFVCEQAFETKREIVHKALRGRFCENPAIGKELLDAALKTLDNNGRARSNPRKQRSYLYPGLEV